MGDNETQDYPEQRNEKALPVDFKGIDSSTPLYVSQTAASY